MLDEMKMAEKIDIEDFKLAIAALWKRKILIVLVTLIGLFSGFLITVNDSQVYSATASVFCATYGSYKLSDTDVRTMVNYSDFISSRKVCEYAASLLNDTEVTADQIQTMIIMSLSDNSYVMRISADSESPELAMKVANAVAEAFVTEVSNITGNDSIQILDEADRYIVSRENDTLKKQLLFAGAAFSAICAIIALKELFSNKVRSITQCLNYVFEDEIFGIVPYFEAGKKQAEVIDSRCYPRREKGRNNNNNQ
jgi:capsular polysaccharide biosynthesis protein